MCSSFPHQGVSLPAGLKKSPGAAQRTFFENDCADMTYEPSNALWFEIIVNRSDRHFNLTVRVHETFEKLQEFILLTGIVRQPPARFANFIALSHKVLR